MHERRPRVEAHRPLPAHFSSEFFRERLAEGLAKVGLPIPRQRWFTNLTSKGNTGAASIFIILEELFNQGPPAHGRAPALLRARERALLQCIHAPDRGRGSREVHKDR